jgi:short-subunit dehydrogenase
MMSFSDRKVIIAGASSGIGKELAILYAASGWRVGITGRRGQLLEELKKQYPLQIETAVFDATGNDNILYLGLLIKKLGGMDLFIYNAGYGEISTTQIR